MNKTLITLFSAALVSSSQAAITFTDWTGRVQLGDGVTPSTATHSIAKGTLNGIAISFEHERFLNSTQVIDGTGTKFADASHFSPSIALTDHLSLVSGDKDASPSDVTNGIVKFSSAIVNPIFQIHDLELNTMVFSENFTLLSSDSELSSTANTLTGTANVLGSDHGRGSIQFIGSFTEISWTVTQATASTGQDAMSFTIAAQAVPEPSSTALLGLGGLALILRRRK